MEFAILALFSSFSWHGMWHQVIRNFLLFEAAKVRKCCLLMAIIAVFSAA